MLTLNAGDDADKAAWLNAVPEDNDTSFIDYASHSQWLDAVADSFDYHKKCRNTPLLPHIASRSEDNPAYQSHRAAVDDAK
eukprot:322848-Pleurochrysis_carterae.AAC.1